MSGRGPLVSCVLVGKARTHNSCLCPADEDDDSRYAQDEFGEQPFHDHGYEDLADAASGKGAFDVMLTTYTLFERVGASNRYGSVSLGRAPWLSALGKMWLACGGALERPACCA